jgi:amidase
MDKLVYQTAVELAESIRSRQFSSVEVVEAFLSQIASHNPTLNAIVTLDEAGARECARQADAALTRGELWGPLHGVPVTIKDSFETAGLRTTSSFKPLANYVPKQDATVVARLRSAGAVILGKTNLPEMAGDFQTDSPVFGIAKNPWDLQRTPGGSSGGEAAALAAGMSPLGIGSDIGGSIRIPAHFCGLFGLKPTDRRVSNAGHIPPLPGSPNSVRYMLVSGPLARSVADLRLCLKLIAGPDGRDASVCPAPLAEPPRQPLSALRFAWSDNFGGIPITHDTRAALAKLADDLTNAGCQVERKNPPDFDFDLAWRTFGELYGAMVYTLMPPPVQFFIRLFGPMQYKDILLRSASRTPNCRVSSFFNTLTNQDRLLLALERFLADYDAWLCPVAAMPAFEHRARNRLDAPLDVDGQMIGGTFSGIGYTTIFSLTGHPVVVAPLAKSKQGLPIGVQIVGRLWSEMDLLSTAEALTEITGPFQPPEGY